MLQISKFHMITHYDEYNIIIVMNCKKIHTENIISENENEYIQQCHVSTTFSLMLSNHESIWTLYPCIVNVICINEEKKKNGIKWRDKKILDSVNSY